MEAPSEEVAAGNIADPFRPRFAVDLQLLDADGNPVKDTPVYPAVPLPVPMAGSEAGMFNFPAPGTLVEVGFTDGRPDKPFVRQTMPQGNNLPAVKPGEQLQQQREGVSQRVTVAGDWERQTDQTISESSMKREIRADEEVRTLVTRSATVQAKDTLTVLGKRTVLAGAMVQVSEGDYSVATAGKLNITCSTDSAVHVGRNAELEVGAALTEKIAGIRRSVAAAQQIIAPVVTIGNGEINLLNLLTDTLDVVNELAQVAARHTHPDTGQSQQAADFTATATKTRTLTAKYSPLIES